MKKLIIAISLLVSSIAMFAQTENGFKKIDVQKDFSQNGYAYFSGSLILCSGDKSEINAMTIGWGAIGNIWGFNRPAMTVYVAPSRHTHKFMEKYKYFTVMEFKDPKCK